MVHLSHRYLVFTLQFLCLKAASQHDNPFITELTSLNFDGVVDGSSHVLVAFIAPWCSHCRALAPALEKLAKHFEEETGFYSSRRTNSRKMVRRGADSPGDSEPPPIVVVARCDATAELSISAAHGVSGYPSLRFFPFGSTVSEPFESVDRSAEAMSKWLIERAGLSEHSVKPYFEPLPVAVALTTATFDSVAYDPSRTVMVLFTAPWCVHCAEIASTFEALAGAFADEEERVGVATVDADSNKGLSERFDVSGFPTLKLFPLNDAPPETYHLDDSDGGGGPSTGAAYLLRQADQLEEAAAAEEIEKGEEEGGESQRGAQFGQGGRNEFEERYQKELPALVAFLNARAGTQRTPKGLLLESAGRSEAVEAFLGERPALLDSLRELSGSGSGSRSGRRAEDGSAVEAAQGGGPNCENKEVESGTCAEAGDKSGNKEQPNQEDQEDQDEVGAGPSEGELERLAGAILSSPPSPADLKALREWGAERAFTAGASGGGGFVLGSGARLARRDSARRALQDLRALVETAGALCASRKAPSPSSSSPSREAAAAEDSMLYVKALEKAYARGEGKEWLSSEERRISSMVERSSVAGKKKTALIKRANVLRAILRLIGV